MGRYEAIIGPRLKARTFDRQQVEAALAARYLIYFTAHGMPKTLRIA